MLSHVIRDRDMWGIEYAVIKNHFYACHRTISLTWLDNFQSIQDSIIDPKKFKLINLKL